MSMVGGERIETRPGRCGVAAKTPCSEGIDWLWIVAEAEKGKPALASLVSCRRAAAFLVFVSSCGLPSSLLCSSPAHAT